MVLFMTAMVFFPDVLLESFAYAGVAAVAFAVVAAIVVTPAAIVLLAIDSQHGRTPAGPAARAGGLLRTPRPVERMFWYRWTKFVMRRRDSDRPCRHCADAGAGRAVPGRPVGFPDDRALPKSASARQLGDDCAASSRTMGDRRHRRGTEAAGLAPAERTRYAAELSRVRRRDVRWRRRAGIFVDGKRAGTAVGAGRLGGRRQRVPDGALAVRRCTPRRPKTSWIDCRYRPTGRPSGRCSPGMAQVNRDDAARSGRGCHWCSG